MADHDRIAVDFDRTLSEGEETYVTEDPERADPNQHFRHERS